MSNTAVSFTPEKCCQLTHRNSLKSTLSVSEIKTTVWFFSSSSGVINEMIDISVGGEKKLFSENASG